MNETRGPPRAGENGNWGCTKCQNVNFPHRQKCNRCGEPKGTEDQFGNWNCPKCRNLNYAHRDRCNRCDLSRPLSQSNEGSAMSGMGIGMGGMGGMTGMGPVGGMAGMAGMAGMGGMGGMGMGGMGGMGGMATQQRYAVESVARSFVQAFSGEGNPVQSAINYLIQLNTTNPLWWLSDNQLPTQAAYQHQGPVLTYGVGTKRQRTFRSPPQEGVDGNWKCLECNNINFSHRTKCNRCAIDKPAARNDRGRTEELFHDGTAGRGSSNTDARC